MKMKVVVLVAAVCSIFPLTARCQESPKPLLPQEAVWKMRYDAKLDGEIHAKDGEAVRWKFAVRNNRIGGNLAGLKDGDPSDHRIAGEVVEGKPAIVSLRQDGPKGLVCFYTGKLTADGRIEGTWFDNRGTAGDFELQVEAK